MIVVVAKYCCLLFMYLILFIPIVKQALVCLCSYPFSYRASENGSHTDSGMPLEGNNQSSHTKVNEWLLNMFYVLLNHSNHPFLLLLLLCLFLTITLLLINYYAFFMFNIITCTVGYPYMHLCKGQIACSQSAHNIVCYHPLQGVPM